MLDEQIREIECRFEESVAEEKRRSCEAISRVERDRDTQLAAITDRLGAAEAEASELKQEVRECRNVCNNEGIECSLIYWHSAFLMRNLSKKSQYHRSMILLVLD